MSAIAVNEYLLPIPGSEPCGPSLRHEEEWDHLKALRREDDSTLPTGVWQAELKRGDWPALEQLAGRLLRERSKDLMIAAWLGEAWLRRQGLRSIAPALQLLVGLCERYPDGLHPRPQEGDCSWRVLPLEWMIGHYSNILLTQVPLFGSDNTGLAHLTLHGWQQLQQHQVQASDSKQDKALAESARLEQRKLNELIRQLPANVFAASLDALNASLAALDRFSQWSDTWLDEQAPSFAPLRQTLENILALLQEFAPMKSDMPPSSTSPSTDSARNGPERSPDAVAPPFGASPNNREEAYRQLTTIADYLARTEPHSPVPYVIRRAVEWGNQPLSELLDELISADGESRRVWKLLGVLK